MNVEHQTQKDQLFEKIKKLHISVISIQNQHSFVGI
jgi:hypothetical protein